MDGESSLHGHHDGKKQPRQRKTKNETKLQDTARERVVLDGEEIAFWGSASDKPHTWHEELWATLESRVMEGLLGEDSPATAAAAANGGTTSGLSNGHGNDKGTGTAGTPPAPAVVVGDNARALAREEWNKARAVATTSEVFKAMSRTGAGGDAYFALVALFCTADKLVVPVHCQESPITVEFLNRCKKGGGGRKSSRHSKSRAAAAGASSKKGANGRTGDDVHVLVTVPSTFDIYLRDGAVAASDSRHGKGSSDSRHGKGSSNSSTHARGNGSVGGSVGGNGGGNKMHRKASTGSTLSNGHGDGAAAADASAALHLVRVKAVVEEEIWVVGSSKVPASSSYKGGGGSGGKGSRPSSIDDDTPPTLRFLLDPSRDERRTSLGADGRRLSKGRLSSRGRSDLQAAGGGRAGGGAGTGELSMSPPPPAPAPLLALTRTERRMCVTVVPEPSAVSEMVRSFSRRIGVDVPGPQPPRVLGR